MKNKYFNTDNLIRIFGATALFFIIKTYNKIDIIGDKLIEHEIRVSLIEFQHKLEAKNEKK